MEVFGYVGLAFGLIAMVYAQDCQKKLKELEARVKVLEEQEDGGDKNQ